jgi:pantetheine-phosphate adenylyltransferase
MAKRTGSSTGADQGRYRTGIYPGTFDPVTNGHLDIVGRAVKVVDKLIVAVAVNIGKEPLFNLRERVAMCRAEIAKLKLPMQVPIEVVPFNNLLMHFVQQASGTVIIRGLRAVSDFEYEFQMAGMNARLNPDVETMFLMASERNQFIASRFVKEIARLGGDVSTFVPAGVNRQIRAKFDK